ncbi:MAG TPA: VOC family protein [Ktedonobacterales bacterium]|jgi:catechol-2,3-dioxygenase|nr:VOC family protein [Ktedonobacterales bacterium]
MTTKVRLGHIALPAQHPEALAAFYQRLLGLEQSLQGTLPQLGDFVFLSDDPDERVVALAFMTNIEARHVAWEVESLAALRDFYAAAKAQGAPVLFALDHGVSLSLYLRDPEGNSVEVYWPTGRAADAAYADPVDLALLEQPDEVLLAQLNAHARS